MLIPGEVTVGSYVVGFGLLYYVADRWQGANVLDEPEFLVANVESDQFQWIAAVELARHFDKVERFLGQP